LDDEQLQKLLSTNFENIKNVEFSYNNITTTINPLKGFQNLYPLETLNLSNNKITQIEDLFYCDIKAKKLNKSIIIIS
jgi:Leucine-rich repeat (LRR) protein